MNTYVLDYLPTFNEGNTYIRGKGGLGYDDPTFVEYDLDSEDFQWLSQINTDGQERLSAEKMEMMLWKLDLANAEATDKVFSFQGQCRSFIHCPKMKQLWHLTICHGFVLQGQQQQKENRFKRAPRQTIYRSKTRCRCFRKLVLLGIVSARPFTPIGRRKGVSLDVPWLDVFRPQPP